MRMRTHAIEQEFELNGLLCKQTSTFRFYYNNLKTSFILYDINFIHNVRALCPHAIFLISNHHNKGRMNERERRKKRRKKVKAKTKQKIGRKEFTY